MGDDWVLSCPSREVVWKRPTWRETHGECYNETSHHEVCSINSYCGDAAAHQFAKKLEAWDAKFLEAGQHDSLQPEETIVGHAQSEDAILDLPVADADSQSPVDSTIVSAVIPFDEVLTSNECEYEEAVSDIEECPVASFSTLKPIVNGAPAPAHENAPHEENLLFCDRPFTEIEQYQHENYLLREELRDTRKCLSRQLRDPEKHSLSTIVDHASRLWSTLWK